MSDVPSRWPEPAPDRPRFDLQRAPSGVEADRHKDRGLDLTPEEVEARRRNRRWMLGIAVPSVAVLVAALVATGVAQHNEPTAPEVPVPAGYTHHNDGYYSYGVPKSWSDNPANTDSVGDVESSGPGGFAGEHIGYRTGPPVIGEAQPASLQAFGQPRAEPYTLSGGHPVSVPGAAAAIEYDVTRPGGYTATAVDAWSAHTGVELWLMVHAPADVTATLLTTLRAR